MDSINITGIKNRMWNKKIRSLEFDSVQALISRPNDRTARTEVMFDDRILSTQSDAIVRSPRNSCQHQVDGSHLVAVALRFRK